MIALNTSLYCLLSAPGGQQIGKAAKKIGQELLEQAPRYGDDVLRQASKNPGFFDSIPMWVWIVLGVIALGAIIYWIDDNF